MAMRICYPFSGDTVGGSHLSVLPLAQALPRDEMEPVFVLHQPGAFSDYLKSRNTPFEMAPKVKLVTGGGVGSQIASMVFAAPRLAAYLKQRQIDIIHTNDARMHLTWGLAARLAGCRFIWHQRSADNSRRNALYAHLAHRILTISDYCQSQLASSMRQRSEIIYDPVISQSTPTDGRETRRRLLKEWRADPATTIVGYVGNLTEQKRPLIFVNMAANLVKMFSDPIKFPMFGELREPLRTSVEKRIDELGLQQHCHLMGPRYPINPWIAALNILVAPAVREGLGRTLVEAMQVGAPIVAANDGGHIEVTDNGQTGILVSPDDSQAFASEVRSLLHDPERIRSLTELARTKAKERFSLDAHVAKMMNVYRNVTP